jgi:uncharacterized membrane protein YebE (DUF533 family)
MVTTNMPSPIVPYLVPTMLVAGGGLAGLTIGKRKNHLVGTAVGLGGGLVAALAFVLWRNAAQQKTAQRFSACLSAQGYPSDAAIATMSDADKATALSTRISILDACAQA